MRATPRLLAVSSLGTAALLAGTIAPASAAEGDTTVTFALTGSTLSVSVSDNATLNGGNTGSEAVSGQLGQVTVTDRRGGTAVWSAKASTTKFTTGTGNPESTSVTYNGGAISTTGTIVIVPKGTQTLTATPTEVAAPTSVVGNNTAAWNPTLTVNLPSDAVAGTYTGTVTTSVS